MKAKYALILALLALVLASCQMMTSSPRTDSTQDAGSVEVVWQRTFVARLTDWLASDKVLYVLDRAKVTALDVTQGQELWQANIGEGEMLNLLNQAVVITNRKAGTVTSIARSNGQTLWTVTLPESDLEHCPRGVQVITGANNIFAGCADRIYALDGNDGHQLWQFRSTTGLLDQTIMSGGGYVDRPFVALAYADGTLYVRMRRFLLDVQSAQAEGQILALNTQTGEEKWRFAFYFFPLPGEEPDAVATLPLIGDKYLFFISYDNIYYFVERETGHGHSNFGRMSGDKPCCLGRARFAHKGIVALGDQMIVWDDDGITSYAPWWEEQKSPPKRLSVAIPDWRQYQAIVIQPSAQPTLWRALVPSDEQGFVVTVTDIVSKKTLAQYAVRVTGVKKSVPSNSYTVILDDYLILSKDEYTLVGVKLPR